MIIFALGTGHGKSVIIQTLANMKSIAGERVIIVCLNYFLAYWGRTIYDSQHIDNRNTEYVSLNCFSKMPVDDNAIVVFDEIDQGLSEIGFVIEK